MFEARAEAGELVQHLVGTPVEHVTWVQRTLRDLLPGLDIDGMTGASTVRMPVMRSVRLRMRPRTFALAVDRAEVISLALLSALDARLEEGERLVVQIVLGRRLLPKHLPKELPVPMQPVWQLVLRWKCRRASPYGIRSMSEPGSTASPPPSASGSLLRAQSGASN